MSVILIALASAALAQASQQAAAPAPTAAPVVEGPRADALPDEQAATGQPPRRIRQVTLAANEACPKSTAEEVVVCGTLNPDEQYRIPKRFRNNGPIPPQNRSWVTRAQFVDEDGRREAGIPNTCSPIGLGGQTGCSELAAKQWAAERAQRRQEAAEVP